MGLALDQLARLRLVRVGDALPEIAFDRFSAWIGEALAGVVEVLETVQYDPPRFEWIETSLLTRALELEIGGHILAVTDADLVDSRGSDFHQFMFGGKDNRNGVAVVSTRRLRRRDGTLPLDRVGKVGLHEVGHNLGLEHHYSFERGEDGGYCPMSKGDFGRYGERAYVRAVIDGRGLRFCRRCFEIARRFASAARASAPEMT